MRLYNPLNMLYYAILLKTRELVQYPVEKRKTIDFSKPEFTIERQDSDDIRQKILSISYTDWKNMGFSKDTFQLLLVEIHIIIIYIPTQVSYLKVLQLQ
jgi:hypothetical protein